MTFLKKIRINTVIKYVLFLISLLTFLTACLQNIMRPGQFQSPQKTATQRVALVIGNGAYQGGPLPNVLYEVDQLAAILQHIGFDVIKVKNASLSDMNLAIAQFSRKLDNSQVCLFYFSGYGTKHQNKINQPDCYPVFY